MKKNHEPNSFIAEIQEYGFKCGIYIGEQVIILCNVFHLISDGGENGPTCWDKITVPLKTQILETFTSLKNDAKYKSIDPAYYAQLQTFRKNVRAEGFNMSSFKKVEKALTMPEQQQWCND